MDEQPEGHKKARRDMTQPVLTKEQEEWRARITKLAYNRETEDAEKENTKKLEIKKRWSACEERAKDLAQKLAHLQGIPVRYDAANGQGVILIRVQRNDWEEDPAEYPEPGDNYECYTVFVEIGRKGNTPYRVYEFGVVYKDAKLDGSTLSNVAYHNRKDVAISQAEKWVEEHAYGTVQ